MNRRSLLVSIGGSLSVSLGGCLDGTLRAVTGTKPTYDECDASIVRTEHLPDPARREVVASLEDGRFETDDELVLEAVMDTDESYLRHDNDYYEPVIETTGEGRRLELEKTLPEASPIHVRNETDGRQLVTLRIEHEGERFFEDEFELEAGDDVSIGEDVEFRYGRYHADVETETTSRLRSWRLNEQYPAVELIVTDTNIDIAKAVVDPYECNWNESGKS